MAVYEYRGLTAEGRSVNGIIDADSLKGARARLRQSGIYPTEVTEGAAASVGPRERLGPRLAFLERMEVGLQDVAVMTRQLATLLEAGLPLMEAFTAVMDQTDRPAFKRIVASLRERVKEGGTFADALRRYPAVFSNVYISMVQAGEASGTLDGMLHRLADYLENQVRLRNQLIATLTYPVFMLIIAVVVLFLIVTFLVPKVVQVFEDMQVALPWPTRMLIGLSTFLSRYWWALLMVGATALIGLQRYISTPTGRRWYDDLRLRSPILGRLILMVSLSRLTRTLSTLLSSGIPLLNALEVSRQVVQNRVLEEAIDRARENIREGESIAEPLRKSRLFPPLVIHMVAVGERSGELETMLIKVAQAYENEVQTKVGTLTALLAPVMILAMGLVVAFLVFAILLPIFEISQVVK
jgi:general secretion pathway protein F